MDRCSRCGRQEGNVPRQPVEALHTPRRLRTQQVESDGVVAAASVAIIEPDDDGVVDDEGLLDLLNLRQRETYQKRQR